ncbi:flavodoxin family protein [Halalkalibaculum sp. DA3122]|uniref:flavodoxin family protein n=1 Tax=unclassified Halalkalibaculum TaxID=2964617 RepID=UPI003754CAC4
MALSKKQEDLCSDSRWDFSNLSALFLNCTLKPSPKESHTETLIGVSRSILEKNNVTTEVLRPVDYDIAPGVYPDMREHGFETDDWPAIQQKVMDANILVIGSPIWLGEKSSVAAKVIERLYGYSGNLNDKGQYAYYGRVGGCLITGNEDGIKHCSMSILYGLQHLGYVIPPQADAGWIGEAGPGPSYGDEVENGRAGFDNEFTQRNTTFMTWNLMHMALMLDQAGGIPAHGNQRSEWEAGCRFDHPNPEHR